VKLEYGTVAKIPCVPSQISQVLVNLFVNAIQAIESLNRPDGGLIQVSIQQRGGEIVIEFTDNGGGIEPESIPRLFDPFFTTKSVGEGTGLGLSICHGIVNGHGGRIEVASKPGEGATFRVILPLRRGSQ
jgi:two-component system, NtrC family, sensor kinase